MQEFVSELDSSREKHDPRKYSDFRRTLDSVGRHPNRPYFIFRSIILNNLYGVDIMPEAVEICKLRLFLKLAAQVDPDPSKPNMGLEPLPDIDFNIRAGNTLVGFAKYDDVKQAVSSALDFDGTMEAIDEKAREVDELFTLFRQQQEIGGEITPQDKQQLRDMLKPLEEELNRYLAARYGDAARDYDAWLTSHQPFHWFVEFYGIMNRGGFDVVIGNPPYVEVSDVSAEYSIRGLDLVSTGNLCAICVERFASLIPPVGRVGVILPISSVSTPRMKPLMQLLASRLSPLHVSSFAVRPDKLFVGVDMNLAIIVAERAAELIEPELYSTEYNRWYSEYRSVLFQALSYTRSGFLSEASCVPKTGSQIARDRLARLGNLPRLGRRRAVSADSDRIYYHSGGRYFRKCLRKRLSNEYKELSVQTGWSDPAICLLSSSMFYWHWITLSDCYHVTKLDVDWVPVPESLVNDKRLNNLADKLDCDLWHNAEVRYRNRADGSQREETNFYVGKSKPIIDEIDCVLAKHYGFTDEELDFIINYDIKYRMGLGGDDGEEAAE